jgi:hypothetical protein
VVQVRHHSPISAASAFEITGMYVVRLHPDVRSFILEPRSPYAGLMLFVVKSDTHVLLKVKLDPLHANALLVDDDFRT